MAFIPTAGHVRCSMEMLWNNQQVINTLWFKSASGAAWTLAERVQLGLDLETWWVNHQRTSISSAVVLRQIGIVNQDTASSPGTIRVLGTPSPGTGGAAAPLNVSLTASFRTELRGRSFRGRIYIPGLQTGALVDQGTYTVAGAAGIATTVGKLLDTLLMSGAILSVVSHFANNQARSAGLSTPVTAIVVETLLDSMRRRLIGRGA